MFTTLISNINKRFIDYRQVDYLKSIKSAVAEMPRERWRVTGVWEVRRRLRLQKVARPAHLRAARFGALGPKLPPGLPTVAHARVVRRDRSLARPAGLEPAAPGLEGQVHLRRYLRC